MKLRTLTVLASAVLLNACSWMQAGQWESVVAQPNDTLVVPPHAPAGDLYPQGEGVGIDTTAERSEEKIELVAAGDTELPEVVIRGAEVPLVWNRGAAEAYDTQIGIASYYWQPQKTATGEQFDPDAFTAAHRTLPFGTVIRVTRMDNKKSVVVHINDRGPYVEGRIVDLSRAAGRVLEMERVGISEVMIEVLAYPAVEMMGPSGTG